MSAAAAIIIVIIANLATYFANRNNYTLGRWIYVPNIVSFRPFVIRGSELAGKGYWFFSGLNPDDLTTPAIGPEWCLMLYRALELMYFMSTLLVESFAGRGTPYEGITPNDWMQYFTNESFCLIPLYAILGFVCHVVKAYNQSRRSHALVPQPGQKYRSYNFFEIAFHLVYQAAASCGLMLTVFFWVVLYDPNSASTKAHKNDNRMRHGFNVVIILFDLLFSRTPIVTYHFHSPLLWTTYYAIFLWIFWGVQDQWVYKVLDWRKSGGAKYYVGIPLLIAVAHFIWLAVACTRYVILEAMEKSRGARSQTDEELAALTKVVYNDH